MQLPALIGGKSLEFLSFKGHEKVQVPKTWREKAIQRGLSAKRENLGCRDRQLTATPTIQSPLLPPLIACYVPHCLIPTETQWSGRPIGIDQPLGA